jgi:hypothetical protein
MSPLPVSNNPPPQTKTRDIALGILQRSGIEPGAGYQLGVSKVFLRAGQMAVLDKQRTGERAAALVACCHLSTLGGEGRAQARCFAVECSTHSPC